MQTTLRSRHHDKKRGTDLLGQASGRLLELPPVVLSVPLLAGLALIGSCVLVFYLYVSLLVGV
jgi:hypothetical protein